MFLIFSQFFFLGKNRFTEEWKSAHYDSFRCGGSHIPLFMTFDISTTNSRFNAAIKNMQKGWQSSPGLRYTVSATDTVIQHFCFLYIIKLIPRPAFPVIQYGRLNDGKRWPYITYWMMKIASQGTTSIYYKTVIAYIGLRLSHLH